MSKKIDVEYSVTGGCVLNEKITCDITEAYFEFFHRIKMTRPQSGCVIRIEKYLTDGEAYYGKPELIHQVVLS